MREEPLAMFFDCEAAAEVRRNEPVRHLYCIRDYSLFASAIHWVTVNLPRGWRCLLQLF
jgi:hypothetical protein